MRKILVLVAALVLAACDTVPITGRQQLSMISDSEMFAMGAREYRGVLKENSVVRSGSQARLVQTVGGRIKNAVEKYFRDKGEAQRLANYHWEFNLIESEERNAFCLPGGKVAIYTGILPVTRDETGLAVVMGHEVAHAIANHGGERMSQHLLAGVAGAAVGVAVAGESPAKQAAFATAFSLGANLAVLLPFSRLHESEADHLGLVFMAMAGYDPREAPQFWRRMAAAGAKEGRPPEFLSTHPSDQTRIHDLESEIPEAMRYYQGGDGSRNAPPAAASSDKPSDRTERRPFTRDTGGESRRPGAVSSDKPSERAARRPVSRDADEESDDDEE
jgi:predicted Zn-dependent protease